jgi:acyl-CoA synthetase (AMP-forming)/AMP-acid ligase II/aryl carrier-like protein
MNATTLSALLHENRNAARAITYLEGEKESRSVSFAQLYERALGILYHLQQLGARPGDRLILLLAGNEPFIDAFWAAVLGGIIPVPLAPGISDEHRHKLLRIARQLGAPFLYTEQRLLDRLGEFAAVQGAGAEFQALRARAFVVDDLHDVARAGREHEVRASDTAFIQFSSGSTSNPKGVVLTHANLIANIRGATEAAHFGPEDVSLSWMPLTHDMGLIGFHLVMFANRVQSHLMPTDLFVRRPLLWLQFASRIRATILCSPNFGYRHYLKLLGDRSISDLDLSTVRLIFNGAEPISVELVEEFLKRLEPARLRRESMFTVYGLAEASLAVSFPPLSRRVRATAFNRHQLGVGQTVEVLGPTERNALLLASVGKPIPYCEVQIADAQDAPLPERQVGHIQIRGANVTAGYLDAPEANAESFTRDGWLRTGDLGVFQDGELYVTGRHKEILFVNGQNYYPHDLESLTHDIEGLDLGKVVVAGVRPEHSESDQIVVFVWYRGEIGDFLPLARQVARRIGEHAGIEITAVVPVKRIPKTTSGKIQRHLLEQEYLDGVFAAELAQLQALADAQPLTAEGHGAIEATLQGFCETALEGRRVGRLDNLFDAGISSLKFMAIHEQIEARWPGLLDITDLFDHPTVAELAHFIESRQGAGNAA